MSAREGNQNWRFRITHGRQKEFTPEELALQIEDYFYWCAENPIKQHKVITSKHGTEDVYIRTDRPFSIEAMCVHIGIVKKTFYNYGNLHKKAAKELNDPFNEKPLEQRKKEMELAKEYLHVFTQAQEIIFAQKFEGAAVGMYKEQIISKTLHLIEKSEVTHKEQPLFPDAHNEGQEDTE